MKKGKKYRSALEKVEKGKAYSIDEALEIIKSNKIAKFDESVEIHVKLGIDTKKGEEVVRSNVVFPHSFGKEKRIAVITSKKQDEAKKAGADIIGADNIITDIKAGKIIGEVDAIIATPEMMPKIASVAKILGPKGLMPSPKTETVTDKIKETVEELKKGKNSFKNDDSGNVHLIIGKVSLDADKIKKNFEIFIDAVEKSKPKDLKGKLISSITVCSTMGPGIKIAR